ncbi:MAG: hypothetical protein AB2L14_16805 [Candidatus Xenobiia bacterium LiM19]
MMSPKIFNIYCFAYNWSTACSIGCRLWIQENKAAEHHHSHIPWQADVTLFGGRQTLPCSVAGRRYPVRWQADIALYLEYTIVPSITLPNV